MKNFILGFAAGIATYHYVLGDDSKELITELRNMIKSVDDRLAEAEKSSKSENMPGTSEPETSAGAPGYTVKEGPSRPETAPPSPPHAA